MVLDANFCDLSESFDHPVSSKMCEGTNDRTNHNAVMRERAYLVRRQRESFEIESLQASREIINNSTSIDQPSLQEVNACHVHGSTSVPTDPSIDRFSAHARGASNGRRFAWSARRPPGASSSMQDQNLLL